MRFVFPFFTALLLLIGLNSFGQDLVYQNLMAGKDDSAKIIRLANYAQKFKDADKVKAVELYGTLLKLSKKLGYPYWEGMSWFNFGYIHAREAKDSLAIVDFQKALTHLKKTDRQDQIASCYINMAALSGRMGKIDQQLQFSQIATQILEPTKYKNLLMYVYNSLGATFYNLDEYDKGLYYFRKAINLGRQINNTSEIVNSFLGVTNCLSSKKRFQEALNNANEALKIASTTKDDFDLCVAHTAFTQLYLQWKKPNPLIKHANEIIKHSVAFGDVQYQLIGLMALADGYGLANEHQKRIYYLDKALAIGKESKTVLQLDDIYKGLSEAHNGLQNYSKALGYYKLFVAHRDSANNLKTKKSAAELDLKYQTVQKEKELSNQRLHIAQNEVLIQKNRQYAFYGLATAIILLLLFILGYLFYRNKRKEYIRDTEALKKDKEIQLLQAVMQGEEQERSRVAKDLHDGVAGMLTASRLHFNSLTPQYDVLIKSPAFRQGVQLLDEAAAEIRKTSHNLMSEILVHYGLDYAIRKYCNNINNSNAIEFVYNSWGEIGRFNDSFELSVYRIVQELLNNILKHSNASQTLVQMNQQDTNLFITIEDNGIGIQEGSKTLDGTGLKNLTSRVEVLNGKIEIESSPGNGVSAYLEFDVTLLQKFNYI
ncbi:tetratricopeptide repeat-containing sensor histidine kinase [Solitalea canadensis]|uniref:histidine kinase n=1 Tax=Solitalea canadensis (strain ATCC 29591 / DSM 3403 / JCM 21819 / LMG 8368 / NBRC 15130 / NCIMB 12057 / USAM 9D) TaxID=929556 RepID=H8KMM5_SOLCM|nr:tetratricopeptide repeat-containing sensor histidine kinase [Solitalea canadensis]AFD09016.1 signal transduction histidine kinase [Solitalea canadensis DSM 3403]